MSLQLFPHKGSLGEQGAWELPDISSGARRSPTGQFRYSFMSLSLPTTIYTITRDKNSRGLPLGRVPVEVPFRGR